MKNTVIAVFEQIQDAQAARDELLMAGFTQEEVTISEQYGQDRVQAESGQSTGFWDTLRQWFGMEESSYYTEAGRRGQCVLRIDTSEDKVDTAVTILDRHQPVDIDHQAEQWRQEGWQAGAAGSSAQAHEQHREPIREREPGAIPLAQEHLRIDKRRTQKGSIRVYTYVVEQPVQQDVTLTQEHAHVERRPTDRPAGEEAFKERTIEVTETREEPIVSKETRVTEEVVVRKDVEQHTETVHDTVRRTEYGVQDLDENELRSEFDREYAGTGRSFDEYRPAFEYGRQVAADERYQNKEWDVIEPEVHKSFEARFPGGWDQYKGAVRSAYQRIRSRSKSR